MILAVTDQKVMVVDKTLMVSGTVGAYVAQFSFSESWEGFGKVAVFQIVGGQSYNINLSTPTCTIPWEVLAQVGKIKIGVYGTRGTTVYPTVWSQEIDVDEGCALGVEPSDPTPTIFDQIVERVGVLETKVANLESRMTTAEGNISSLGTRMTTAEGKLANLDYTVVSTF